MTQLSKNIPIGSGLELSVAKGIVDELDGHVGVISIHPLIMEARFFVKLPLNVALVAPKTIGENNVT